MTQEKVLVVLFGYDSSPFTQKVKLALRIKQIPYTYVVVPSMMPRPVLRDNFNLTYRKIPVLAIGRKVYCDTSLIIEALEHFFKDGYPSLYPPATDGRDNRALIRGFASYWTDRPLFRAATGLIPSSVWRTHFGTDRAELIGHKLDADKLEKKVTLNLTNLDLHLSILEPQLRANPTSFPYIFSTQSPSLADISLHYQLSWACDIAAGRGINNLTGGGTPDTNTEGATSVFNAERYPAVLKWFAAVTDFIEHLPLKETRTTRFDDVKSQLTECIQYGVGLIPTPNATHELLDTMNGLSVGMVVSIAPDDTGRNNPTLGILTALSPEEVIIEPLQLDTPAVVECSLHFPRLGFVVKPVDVSKL